MPRDPLSAPVDLRVCPACGVAVPAAGGRCPECGAPLEAEGPPRRGPTGSPFPGRGGPQDAFGVGGPEVVRAVLARNVGCLVRVLAVVFGLPVLVGALAGNALGGLAVALLVVGGAGLLLTAWLVALLRRR